MKKNLVLPQIGNHIGRDEYTKLKKKEDPTDDELKSIEFYEELQVRMHEGVLKNRELLMALVDKDFEVPDVVVDAKSLYRAFVKTFTEVVGKPFDKDNEELLNNILPLIFYFSNDERFFSCANLSKLSEPSFEKGLLIIGGYGNGKTTAMLILEKLFKNAKGKAFKGFTTNEIVTLYEACDNEFKISDFEKTMNRGKRYFDDLGTERDASRYGKVNVMKEILESRYINTKRDEKNAMRTYITMNFSEEHPGDIEQAIWWIGEKYGSRIYDRVFEMYNIIEFKGKSFRR